MARSTGPDSAGESAALGGDRASSPMDTDTTTYVYAIVRASRAPRLADAPPGMAETRPPRALAVDEGLWLVVADAPAATYSEAAIERGLRDIDWVAGRAVEHEAVVEHLLTSGTVVPMKLFTLFLGDERALDDLRSRRGALEAVLDAIEGKREWGVRVLLEPLRAAEVARAGSVDEDEATASAGTAFLLRKRRELDAGRALRARLLGRAGELHHELAALAADSRNRPPAAGEGRLLLDASFLVDEGGAQAFHAAVAARSEELARDGLEVAVSGPWPAYNFVEPAP